MDIVNHSFNDKYKQRVIEELTTIIENVEYQYPELKNSLSQQEMQIICDVVYEHCIKTNKVNQYLEIMTHYFCNV